MKKTKAKIIGSLIGASVLYFACSEINGRMDEISNSAREEKARVARELEECGKSPDVVKVSDVMAMMKQNEAKVSRMWKGSCVKISGIVKSVDEGPLGGLIVQISDGSRFSINNIHCKPTSEKKALELSSGNPITAWGVGGNEIMGSLFLESCSW